MTTETKEGPPISLAENFLANNPNVITADDFGPTTTTTPPKVIEKKTGKWVRKLMRPEGLNLSDMLLPPLTRKLTATYEVLMEAKIDPRVVEGDRGIPPVPLDLTPTYPLYDPGEEDFSLRNKMMKNVVRSAVRMIRQPDGTMKPIVDEELGYVEFINGQKVVNIQKEYILFAFLELHPQNESNKWRDKSKKPWFRRTDFDYKGAHVQLLEMDLQDEANTYIKGLNEKELINLATALNIPAINVPTSDIRYNLRLRARNDPKEVLYKSPDKKASVRIDIMHAMEVGVLEFVPEKIAYFFPGDDKNPFFEVQIDANPLEDLSKHLASVDGKTDYEAMMAYVNYWRG